MLATHDHIRTIDAHLADGDFYAGEPIASFAWPLLIQAGGTGSGPS
jgi:hypothetical protein